MTRATTPTHIFQFPVGVTFDEMLITYSQNGQIVLEKTKEDLTFDNDGKGSYMLTQEEANLFAEGLVSLQIRARVGEKVYATDIGLFRVNDVLDDDVLPREVAE